jgi:antitoxin ParD1/3/4
VNITLTPEVEKLVRERIERGDYENADILVQEAVNRLLQEDHAERERLRQVLQEGVDDLERGDHADYDEHTIQELANDIHQRGLLNTLPSNITTTSASCEHSRDRSPSLRIQPAAMERHY